MRGLALVLLSVLMLGACADKATRVEFDGNYYPAKAKMVKGDREAFVVTVRRAGQGLDGARRAGRHAAVRYCVETFGYSEIDWARDPETAGAQLASSRGNLILRGRCRVWE